MAVTMINHLIITMMTTTLVYEVGWQLESVSLAKQLGMSIIFNDDKDAYPHCRWFQYFEDDGYSMMVYDIKDAFGCA